MGFWFMSSQVFFLWFLSSCVLFLFSLQHCITNEFTICRHSNFIACNLPMYNVERNYPYGSPSQRSLACRSRTIVSCSTPDQKDDYFIDKKVIR